MADFQQRGRQLVTQASQNMNEAVRVMRSRFVTEWSHLKTFDAGKLYPFFFDEVYPGEHHKYDVQAFVRMATMLFPQFTQQVLETFFFFVPTRLVWDNFPRFMGEQPTPGATIDFTVPVVTSNSGGFALHSLYDHFGIPIAPYITVSEVNALPLRCYNLIWNSMYRDQDLQNPVPVNTGDGPDPVTDYAILSRSKFPDFFTTLRPWPQKFDAPTVPVGGQAPIVGLGYDGLSSLSGAFTDVNTGAAVTYPLYNTNNNLKADLGSVYADLTAATGVSINQLRQAVLIQQIYERDARFGTRYIETVKAHWDVNVPDYRLQRPEYFGGGRSELNVSAVAQTATGGGGVAALGATGTLAGQHGGSYAALEHGYIIGLVNIRTALIYQQGMHPFWLRRNRFDYAYPLTSQLGEQAVLRGMLYHTGTPADDTVFGYAPRHDELRQRWSEATGLFRSQVAGNIDEWHLGQMFGGISLNSDFITDTPPVSRVLSAGDQANNQQYLGDFLIRRTSVRALPVHARPLTFGSM